MPPILARHPEQSMSFLIRFLAVVAVIFYFSPERGGGDAGAPASSVMIQDLPVPAPSLDTPQEAAVPHREDDPVDSIAALLLREFGPELDAIPQRARERLAEEIVRGMGLETPPLRE